MSSSNENDHLQKVKNAMKCFELSNTDLSRVSEMILQDLERGLSPETREKATLKMLPTFVRNLPDGSEQGKFLAVDIGGTNIRVLVVKVDGKELKAESESHEIPESVKLGPGEDLFDMIAEHLADLIEDENLSNEMLHIGFTFSFSCEQESLNCAKLLEWSKGFKCPGVMGQDVVQLLKEALIKGGVANIGQIAVLNDSTGALISCAHSNPDCRIALIVGTGTNVCYVENISNVKTYSFDIDKSDEILINTEMGGFGSNGCLEFIRTTIDKEIDIESTNPNAHLFEKMISGKYVGEIVRIVILKLVKDGIILCGRSTECLEAKNTFKSKYVSRVEEDEGKESAMWVFREIGVKNASEKDCEIMKFVCAKVSSRSAFLASAAISAILNKLERPHTTIGVDGSLYRRHPHYKRLMEEKTTELTRPEFKFNLVQAEDGSGRGAALLAAIVTRSAHEEKARRI